jgi:hypothetical protein
MPGRMPATTVSLAWLFADSGLFYTKMPAMPGTILLLNRKIINIYAKATEKSPGLLALLAFSWYLGWNRHFCAYLQARYLALPGLFGGR